MTYEALQSDISTIITIGIMIGVICVVVGLWGFYLIWKEENEEKDCNTIK
jgi:H+/gluconate symporter-like permease